MRNKSTNLEGKYSLKGSKLQSQDKELILCYRKNPTNKPPRYLMAPNTTGTLEYISSIYEYPSQTLVEYQGVKYQVTFKPGEMILKALES